ncbi:MAG: SIS domain-containing protein [Alphaproteobacteria bacterium]|nr:SIS domain-containing protein [Alphaproteobacteria bacterium]
MDNAHFERFFDAATRICATLDQDLLSRMTETLLATREAGGRLFVLGVGGSAGNASHAVNDFRKLCGIEAYAPTDNVSELTARTNDEGWETVFQQWLRTSRGRADDAVLIFSVGGGNKERAVSINLVNAIDEALDRDMTVLAVVGRADGYAAAKADVCIVVPSPEPDLVTPLSEAFQALVWHSLVSHPALQTNKTKW